MDKVVLAYSGGLDTSVSIRWLQEKYGMEVVTLTLDIGQKEDLTEIEEKAKSLRAKSHYFIDAKEEFANGFIFPAIKANALYEGKYPLGTALARPLIASKLVEVAEMENAKAVAHGCTGKGNDQVRFEVTIKSLNPKLRIIAPVREWNMSREEELEYAREHRIPVKKSKSNYSVDQNLWGRSIEGGALEDPSKEPEPDAFEWILPFEKAPNKAEYISIGFKNGVPISLNGVEMEPVELISEANRVSGLHGIGIIDHMEDRLVGIKSREVYEYPAATCIIEAHRDLEKLVLTKHELEFKNLVDSRWSWLVYNGLWVDPLREALDAFIDSTQLRVEGEVNLKLYKGNVRVVGRTSPSSLYDLKLSTYDAGSTFDQSAAKGFVDLWGLSSQKAYGIGMKRRKEKELGPLERRAVRRGSS